MNKTISLSEMVNELEINRHIDHLSRLKNIDNPKIIKQNKYSYEFTIKNIEYIVIFINMILLNKEKIVDVSFTNKTAVDNVRGAIDVSDFYTDLNNAKFGLTKTGNSILVFNEIYNIVAKYLEKYKPTYIKFEAVEDNRKKLYTTLIKKAEKETNLKFNRTFTNPIDGYIVSKNSQIEIYKVRY